MDKLTMTQHKHKRITAALGALALVAGLVLLAVGGAAADESLVDAERTAETTVVEPGDEIDVEIEFTLDDETHLNIVEALRPAIGDLDEYELTHESDGTIAPDFAAWESNGGVLLFDDLPAGEYELAYEITVDDDAERGQTYDFDGAVQLADESTQERQEQFESATLEDARLDSDDELSGDSYLQVATVAEGETISLGNVTGHDPDNQTVGIDVSIAEDGTEGTLALERDDDTVASHDFSGDNDETRNVQIPMTGLATDEFELVANASAGSFEVDHTRMITDHHDVFNATENQTVEVDVEFDASDYSEATVLFEQGTESNETVLEFDPVDYEDGSGLLTAEWDAETDGYVDVTVETEPADSYEASWAAQGGGLFGGPGLFGASSTQILGFLAVVGALLFAYNRDMI